jgi:hypothetical protein
MRSITLRLTCLAAAVSVTGIAAPAIAGTGCNGVVNVFVWGCAPWDNNNGPQFPYFKKKVIELPKEGTQIVTKNGAQMALRGGVYYPIVAGGAGNIVAGGAGNIVAGGAGNLKVWSGQ